MQKRRTNLNWDDCRFVLAISRGGSMLAASRTLHVDQTTVARRLSKLEKHLGTSLFLRSRKSCPPTEAGEALISHAEAMESAAFAILSDVAQVAEQPRGMVRIATMPWLFTHLIVPALPSLRARYAGLSILAISGLRERSLGKREAEMSLRFEEKRSAHEVEIPIAQFDYAVYAPRGKDPASLPWAGFSEEIIQVAPQVWFEQNLKAKDEIFFQANDAGIIYRAVRSGMAKALIPEVLAEDDPTLQRISGEKPEIRRTLRALVHRNMMHVARVKAVIDWLREDALNVAGNG